MLSSWSESDDITFKSFLKSRSPHKTPKFLYVMLLGSKYSCKVPLLSLYVCMFFMAPITTMILCARFQDSVLSVSVRRARVVSRLLDLRAEESRVLRHVCIVCMEPMILCIGSQYRHVSAVALGTCHDSYSHRAWYT